MANIEPKVPLPQPVINFGTRKLAGMLLFYLQKHVRRRRSDGGWILYFFCFCFGARRWRGQSVDWRIHKQEPNTIHPSILLSIHPHHPSIHPCFHPPIQARRIAQDPLGNAHARRMRRRSFYKDYFIPRILSICLDRVCWRLLDGSSGCARLTWLGPSQRTHATHTQGWELGPVPVFEAAGLEAEDDENEEDEEDEEEEKEEEKFRGGARALARDTRRVWREERARFERAVRARRLAQRQQQQQRQAGAGLQSPVVDGRGGGMPASPLLQAFASLASLTGGGQAKDEDEEVEEAEEDTAELLALAASWSSFQSQGQSNDNNNNNNNNNNNPGGSAGAVEAHAPSYRQPQPLAMPLVSATLHSLRRLLPLLALAGGLPWLLYRHTSPSTPAQKVLVLLGTALLRQVGVALVAPRSRALRRAAFAASVAFCLGAAAALPWAAYRCVA